MNSDIKIGVIGGDLRQLVAAGELAECGYETAIYGFDSYSGSFGLVTRCVGIEDSIRSADIIVLPLPYSLDKIHLNMPLSQTEIHLDHLFSLINKKQIVIGGKFDAVAEDMAKFYGFKLIDYYLREDLTIMNAIPTAEGALNIAMQELPITIAGSRSLVLGYGRIGKVLAQKLNALDSKVFVTARKNEDFAWINAYGYEGITYESLDVIINNFDVIFNTIPNLILDYGRLIKLKENVVIIDLASNPGGVDFNAAKQLSLNVIWALSLPGKYAPVTSGRTLSSVIKKVMRDEGLTV